MTPKQRRERLFKPHKPKIRRLELFDTSDGTQKYHKDVAIMWIAYSKRTFPGFKVGLTQSEFALEIERMSKEWMMYIIEDDNKQFGSGSGPNAFIIAGYDGWTLTPHSEYFLWATPRNKLRMAVSFFHYIRYQKIGVCLVHSLKASTPLFDKLCTYGVLRFVGKVRRGDSRGDDYLYSIEGSLS